MYVRGQVGSDRGKMMFVIFILLFTYFIITMIKLLDADWLRRVQLFH